MELGRYFKRHGMEGEVKALRLYYRYVRDLLNPKPITEAAPPHQLVEHYAAVLRIAPFDELYPVREHRSPCSCGAAGWRIEEQQFPDRWFVKCRDCDAQWLVLTKP